MAEFAYDNDPLLNGKSDAGPLGVPANQGVTATEWNTSQQHDDDLRVAIKEGRYHGLSQSAESAAASNKVKLRLSSAASGIVANTLQASVNAGVYKSLIPDFIHVRDYGAVGDGSTDDAAAIQAAFDAAFAVGKPVFFDAKTYLVNTELKVVVPNITILGWGEFQTILKAGASIRSVLRLGVDSGEAGSDTRVTIRDLAIQGNRLAKYGLMILRSSNSFFENINVSGTTYDGFYTAFKNTDDSVNCVNDNNMFVNCGASNCGTIIGTTEFDDPTDAVEDTRHVGYYVAANQFQLTTATVARNSSTTITGTGTTFLTWGVRSGDTIRIGIAPNTEYFTIQTVDSETQLTTSKAATITSATQPFSIGRGAGYWEDGHTDNNINKIYGGLWRQNAGYAMAFRGIYGPIVEGSFIDFHRYWGIRVGNNSGQYYSGGTTFRSGGGTGPVITSNFKGIYFEAIGKKPFFLRAATDFNASGCMDLNYETDPIDMVPADCTGTYDNRRGRHDIKAYETSYPDATIIDYIPGKWLRNGLNEGTFSFDRRIYTYTTDWVVGTTVSLTKAMNELNPGGANRTLTSTPHFTIANNQYAVVANPAGSGFNVILQDEAVLPNSKMYLAGSVNVTLTPGSTITFYCDGTYWREIGRCVR